MTDEILLNWGSYDVDNFGDLLFPFVVEHNLGNRYQQIIHVSPTGTRSIWPDARPTYTLAEALTATKIGGLVVGGGNLVSWTASSSVNYVERREFSKIVHPSFSWVPYILLAKYGIPYAYNYVGVAKRIPPERRGLTKLVIEPACFMSCRDHASARHLREAGVTSPIVVGPDSATAIGRVFPSSMLTAHYHSEAAKKYGLPEHGDTAVVHVKERYLNDQHEEVAQIIAMLSAHSIRCILMPLGMCHRDDIVLSDRRIQACSATRIAKPERLIDMLSILASSKYYIGSSLHGAIVSLAYANKIALVADEEASGLSKFSGFLAYVDLPGCLYRSWRDAAVSLASRGTFIFGSLSSLRANELADRRDSWDEIHRNLRAARTAPHSLVPHTALAQAVRDHYGI